MPIYEFYCKNCNTIFNFFSKSIDTSTCPNCPKCENKKLARQISLFAFTGKAKESGDMEEIPFDESKMEHAMNALSKEADINEDDPRKAAELMRKLSHMTGVKLGEGMEEALARLEKGEDPDKIEAEMGDIIKGEDPFLMPEKKGKAYEVKRQEPFKDDTLYDLFPA